MLLILVQPGGKVDYTQLLNRGLSRVCHTLYQLFLSDEIAAKDVTSLLYMNPQHVDFFENEPKILLWKKVLSHAISKMNDYGKKILQQDDALVYGYIVEDYHNLYLPQLIESGECLPENVSWVDIFHYCLDEIVKILESNGNDSKPSSTDEVSSASLHLYELFRSGKIPANDSTSLTEKMCRASKFFYKKFKSDGDSPNPDDDYLIYGDLEKDHPPPSTKKGNPTTPKK